MVVLAGIALPGRIVRHGHVRAARSRAGSLPARSCVTWWRRSCNDDGRLSRSPAGLKLAFPTSPEMQVSHETIYRTLFVQSRGALRRELTRYLRTGRVIRRPKGVRMPDGRGGRPNILHISERPAEAGTGRFPGTGKGTWCSART
jgi:hypothetical protein